MPNAYKSDIPAAAVERIVSEYRREGGLIYLRTAECVLDGKVVGRRLYDGAGKLLKETPLRDGIKHGREYEWHFWDGKLLSVEPYVNGKMHGTAKQFGRGGRVVGTYRMRHGTGYDIWRGGDEAGRTCIAEIHSMRDGLPHGYEWWVKQDQRAVYHERHWHEGQWHGIERKWNHVGRLRRGYPIYWVRDRQVTKREYLKAARADATLPAYRREDDAPWRSFPTNIMKVRAKSNKVKADQKGAPKRR